ncbi:MAG: DMT family transporter [Marinilabiliaceae bacterium]|nr:DMT family transporter [Marinilabiliaceae bacterium]
MWFVLALLSALCLGFYDVLRKYSLKDNAVLPVLLGSTLTSSLMLLPVLVLSQMGLVPDDAFFYIPAISFHQHMLLVAKAAIVLGSWVFVYYGLRDLPLSIVSPIRATAPIWTLIGALIIFAERPNIIQWIGLVVTMAFFFLFSTAGKREGINFKSNRAVWFVVIGTIIGSCSALFDKYVVVNANIPRMAILCYYSFYQVLFVIPLLFIIWWPQREKQPFVWKPTIPAIGVIIILADFIYYGAIACPGALISLISPLRRSNAIVAFLMAYFIFKERNMLRKGLCLIGIMAGITIIVLGSL